MMCPQLYLNYKLQSVAHLPWRMLTYKFLVRSYLPRPFNWDPNSLA